MRVPASMTSQVLMRAAPANGAPASVGSRGLASAAAHALLAPYLDAVAKLNPGGELRHYPGSPLMALSLMRRRIG